ncbi:MAG TPA: SWIB/MDM2 domain-containing protein [Terriglobales bacterium]|nr:SWIB/MDM2 domain-containing protein [Terriglobales bacterium]
MANALNQKLRPSPELARITGSSQPVTRAEAIKKLWDYVKQQDLQNPENKREILADDNLRPLFGKDKITMFEVGKIINSHLLADKAGSQKKKAA